MISFKLRYIFTINHIIYEPGATHCLFTQSSNTSSFETLQHILNIQNWLELKNWNPEEIPKNKTY